MPKLTDTQLIILSTASQRSDGTALPLPKSVKADDKARISALKGLLKARLLAEQPTRRDGAVWRENKDGQRLGLAITDAGRAALGYDQSTGKVAVSATMAKGHKGDPKKPALKGKSKVAAKPLKRPKGKTTPAGTARGNTKQQALIDLLRRPGGATVEEAMKATGWQAHSVRGAISGALKKKLGLTIESERVEGRGRVYRITDGK